MGRPESAAPEPNVKALGCVPGGLNSLESRVFNAPLERSRRRRIDRVTQSSCETDEGFTMADLSGLSDEALAVFAFAAYHQLSSGQMVRSVIQRDGEGHKASDAAVSELSGRGLIEADGSEIRFTPQGEEALQGVVSGIRGA
jgi:hypothetical protein